MQLLPESVGQNRRIEEERLHCRVMFYSASDVANAFDEVQARTASALWSL